MGYIGSTEKVSTSNSISPFRVFKNNANNNNFELKEQDKGSVKVDLAPPLGDGVQDIGLGERGI